MDQPLVSIVLTLYNGEEFIRQTIENICAQTYANWELIVVNDASTDRSSEIVHSFTDPRIRIIDLPELKVPHPDMQNRDFVLCPLAQIAPDAVHPVLRKTIKQLWKELQNRGRSENGNR